MSNKPLGHKSYGSIPHFSTSKLGPGDYHCHEGQERIATVQTRDKHDIVIVQEKLDGGNVGIAKLNGEILALTRYGYLAYTSPYETHWIFEKWVMQNAKRFDALLYEGERVCGEWLFHAVGTRYNLPHEPFVAFDIMIGSQRESMFTASKRLCHHDFTLANTIHVGSALPIDSAIQLLDTGKHGAIDPVEGVVYRVERNGKVDFLAKHVNANHKTGQYLPEFSNKPYLVNSFI